MMFILTIGNTAVSRIKGITAAGGNEELIKFTPPADAEYLFYDRPRCINSIPVTPSGNPTPAIITKADRELVKFPVLVVRVGSIAEPLISPYDFLMSFASKKVCYKTIESNKIEIIAKAMQK